jgi:hypothetical protein
MSMKAAKTAAIITASLLIAVTASLGLVAILAILSTVNPIAGLLAFLAAVGLGSFVLFYSLIKADET